MFLRLPGDIWRELLSDWLDVLSCGKLDVAVCSNELRSVFLSVIDGCSNSRVPNWAIPGRLFKSPPPIKSLYDWIHTRKVRLVTLELSERLLEYHKVDNDVATLPSTIPLIGENVQCLRASGWYGNITSIVNMFPNLSSLTCSGGSVDFKKVDVRILKHLKALSLTVDRSSCNKILTHYQDVCDIVSEHCNELQTFKIERSSGYQDFSRCLKIIVNNPNLSDISMELSSELITGIVTHLSQSLTRLSARGGFGPSDIDIIMEQCKQLKFFHFDVEGLVTITADRVKRSYELYVGPYAEYEKCKHYARDQISLSLFFNKPVKMKWLKPLLTANCDTVKHLSFTRNGFGKESDVTDVLKLFKHITSLKLSLDSGNMASILPAAPLLEVLHLSVNLSTAEMKHIFQYCKNLKCVEIDSTRWGRSVNYSKLDIELIEVHVPMYRNLRGECAEFSMKWGDGGDAKMLNFDGVRWVK